MVSRAEPSSKTRSVNAEQPLNAEDSTEVIAAGILNDVRLTQLLNALSIMEVSDDFSGSVQETSSVHPLNAFFPIEVREAGSAMETIG